MSSPLRLASFIFAVSLFFIWEIAYPSELPRLKGLQTNACVQTLKLATEAFLSTEPDLRHAGPIPANHPVHLVLALTQDGVSDYAEHPRFEFFNRYSGTKEGIYLEQLLDQTDEGIYLQKELENSVRLAIRKIWDGSGPKFEIRTLPATMNLDRLGQWLDGDSLYKLETRFPVRVYASAGRAWWLIAGDGYNAFSDWTVYVLRDKMLSQECLIQFLPQHFNLRSFLPPAARQLAQLLSHTLGSGRNEGSLHPTARLRLQAEKAWTNLLLRPWAEISAPYNTREEVDRELARWSKFSSRNRRHYRAILRHLQIAKRAIASVYRNSFHMSEAEAQRRAIKNIDLTFRSYYVFPVN